MTTDHVCIVWCKQLVLKLTRLLFDLIDSDSLKIISNNSKRNDIIRYHLMERILDKSYPKVFISEYTALSAVGDWNENWERIIRIAKPKVFQT